MYKPFQKEGGRGVGTRARREAWDGALVAEIIAHKLWFFDQWSWSLIVDVSFPSVQQAQEIAVVSSSLFFSGS